MLSEVDSSTTNKLVNWATTKGSCRANTKGLTEHSMQVPSDGEKTDIPLSEANQETTNY